ncbi:hypothetical protein H8959_006748 [Pygathrix nigripes]
MAPRGGGGEQCPPTPWWQVRRHGGAGHAGRGALGEGRGLRAPLLCAGLLRTARRGRCSLLRQAAARPRPRPARSWPLARTPPHSSAAAAAAASVGATLGQPPLAALPPGPHSAPQEGEGRGAVAAARLTEPGGPLKGAAPWAQGGGPRRRLPHRAATLPPSLCLLGNSGPNNGELDCSTRSPGVPHKKDTGLPGPKRPFQHRGPGQFCSPETGTLGSPPARRTSPRASTAACPQAPPPTSCSRTRAALLRRTRSSPPTEATFPLCPSPRRSAISVTGSCPVFVSEATIVGVRKTGQIWPKDGEGTFHGDSGRTGWDPTAPSAGENAELLMPQSPGDGKHAGVSQQMKE